MIRDKQSEALSIKHKAKDPKPKKSRLSPMRQAIQARAEAGKALGLTGPAAYDTFLLMFSVA
jgi:hypothetical protein